MTTVSPRRLTGAEEQELLKVAARLEAADNEAAQARAERNRLVLELVDSKVRIVDIADVLKLSPKAIMDARDRAREQ